MGTRDRSLIPNSHPTPNVYVDQLMHLLSSNEYKVLQYAARRIFGFGKRADRISVRQFVSGTEVPGHGRVDHGTGLSFDAVSKALAELQKHRILVQTAENDLKKNEGAEYRLQLDAGLIDWTGLEKRATEKAEKGRSKTAAGRLKWQEMKTDPPSEGGEEGCSVQQSTPPDGTAEEGCSVQQNTSEGGALSNRTPRQGCSVQQNTLLCPTEHPVLLDRTGGALLDRASESQRESHGESQTPVVVDADAGMAPSTLADPALADPGLTSGGDVEPQWKLGINDVLMRYYGGVVVKSDDLHEVLSVVEQWRRAGKAVTREHLLQAADNARQWWLDRRHGQPRTLNPFFIALRELINPAPLQTTKLKENANGYANSQRGPQQNRRNGRAGGSGDRPGTGGGSDYDRKSREAAERLRRQMEQSGKGTD